MTIDPDDWITTEITRQRDNWITPQDA